MGKVYKVIAETFQIFNVEANTEKEAIELLETKLKAENPREIYTLKVAEEKDE